MSKQNPSTQVRGRARRSLIQLLMWYAVAVLLTALFVLPMVSMFAGSLRQPGLPPPRGIEWLPNPLTWSNYPLTFQTVELGRYALNTLVVEALAVPVTLLVASWAGFALAQLPSTLARRIIAGALLLLLLPETALWVSRFILYKLAGVIDTPVALAAPSLLGTTPLYMLVFYWTFRRVPKETWEAAQLDGAGAFRCWWSLGIPAARAAFAAIGVLAFVYYWREFNEPLLYIQSIKKYTLSVGLAYLEQLDPTNWPLLMAGSVLITAPLLVVFLVAQPFFLEPLDRPRPTSPGGDS
ncbi:MAG TPA: carbohydrate ABC transporter permease [Chloroflexia bacterium]